MELKKPPDISCFEQGHCPRLNFIVNKEGISFFFRLLQDGFWLSVSTGKSIKQMLCNQIGLSHDYLDNRIKTVFYNGSPVDNVEKAIVKDGTTLALSAAMPGLVGATFRSGGVLSSFRATISYHPNETETAEGKKGVIFLKLFNLLIPEIGPAFLRKGILIENTSLNSHLKDQSPKLREQCRVVLLNNQPMEPEQLLLQGLPEANGWTLLTVKIQGE